MQVIFFSPLVIIIQWYLHTIQFLWYKSVPLFKCLLFTLWSFVILLDARAELYIFYFSSDKYF